MSRTVCPLLALCLAVPPATTGAQTTPTPPAEQYRAILKESQALYDAAQKRFAASAPKGGTPSDEQRTALVGRAYAIKYEQAPKLVALAEKYPSDPIALDALTQAVWQVNTVPYPVEMVGRDDARPKAFAMRARTSAPP